MQKMLYNYNSKNQEFKFEHMITNSPTNFPVHIHDSYEIFYLLSGNLTFFIEGQAYEMKPKDLLFINNRELHRLVFDEAGIYERIVIYFKPQYVSFYQSPQYNLLYCFEKRKPGAHSKIESADVYNEKIYRYLEKIENSIRENHPESPILIQTLFIQMLIDMNRHFTQNKSSVFNAPKFDEKVIRILEYINDHLHEQINLDLLQDVFYINKYYLSHIFKKNTGFSVIEYITYKRIIKAKELLGSGVSAIETCHLVGFNDYSNFYKIFKKTVGMSPKSYTKAMKVHK